MISNLLARVRNVLPWLLIALGLLTSSTASSNNCPFATCTMAWGRYRPWLFQEDLFIHNSGGSARMYDGGVLERNDGGSESPEPRNPKDQDDDGNIDCWRNITTEPDAAISPIGGERGHGGLDIKVWGGTPVFAVGNGVVIEVGYNSNNGLFVRLNLDNDNQVVYLHFESNSNTNSIGLNVGDRVEVGQLIGFSGRTGSVEGVNGYHVHVEAIENYRGSRRAPDSYTRLDPVEEYGGPNCQAAEEE